MLSRVYTQLGLYPLNLFLSSKLTDPSFTINTFLSQLHSLNGTNSTTTDPNTFPTLVDYKLVSPTNPLFTIFQNHLLTPQPTPTPDSTLLILSLSKQLLSSNTNFLKSLNTSSPSSSSSTPFTIQAALLNTHTYPYLTNEIAAQSIPTKTCQNLQSVAHFGLINVLKQQNGSLLLLKN